MNKKILTLIGIGAIALVYALNLSYAMDNYGILKNTLSIDVLAQNTSSGKSSSGKGTGTGSGTNQPEDDKWTAFYPDCYDNKGNKTGSKKTCFQPGFSSSCTASGCN